MEPFSSSQQFQATFHQGLEDLLAKPDPTPAQLVLVMANAIMLHDQPLLDAVHQSAQPHLDPATNDGEDAQILQYALTGSDPFALIHHRTTPAGRLVQFNELRARRPTREAGAPATTIHRPFDATKFNFTRVPDESYWHGNWQGHEAAFYYNKYPFESYHTSIVPEPGEGHEQFLRQSDHQFAWDSQKALSQAQPELILAYNSLGAYASVNHLHFQMIPQGARLPLIQASDLAKYPFPATAHATPESAWEHINRLQTGNKPFNLTYAQGRAIVLERKFQGTYHQPAWNTGFAWYELAGGLIITDQAAFETLTDAQIDQALAEVIAPS